jgi:type IV pilus assembly protein PilY1
LINLLRKQLATIKLRAQTQLADLSTNNGSATTPSGLAYISGWVDHTNTDNTVEAVYGGDLTGYVWRFDLSGGRRPAGACSLSPN